MNKENKGIMCPHTENCIVYQNWASQVEIRDERIDLIKEVERRYVCLAVKVLQEYESGIEAKNEVTKKIKDPNFECSYIILLNK